jgi:hypothetical protein
MQIELVLALISAAVALASAAIALWGQVRTTRLAADLEGLRVTEQRRFDAERATARYREPLARRPTICKAGCTTSCSRTFWRCILNAATSVSAPTSSTTPHS